VLLELGNGNASAAYRHTQQLRSIRPDLTIVARSVSGGSRRIVEAIRLGAQRLLEHPFAGDRIAASARTIFGAQTGEAAITGSTEALEEFGEGEFFVAASPKCARCACKRGFS
jgi:DNA-binding NtrC family response regulator